MKPKDQTKKSRVISNNEVRIIYEKPTGRYLNKVIKLYAKGIHVEKMVLRIELIEGIGKKPKMVEEDLVFYEMEARRVLHLHYNALVFTL